mmetsp:Transcript_10378/g.18056  ORF Transcript_10378/g.18056 Transcript_10378/m.18056 type:complete len:505 (-) Transcript_10378:924-2438(-)|eukprot:CAMPEP_0119103106 /NCGR_PEP_ID=MMETSP1180-20130426/1648_1 /TAXON_ID=3052 ORGANISM="Chlamydomonas cf sp, Strain CCMP681" /NCGR_SAMPLE_ID=MMETSP1180 /ASSEMBLY_ACC=CAM_ASM_000741 /LENGTH=504 /DNA_ID=CAMNT_0007087543 /DNA_START=45 /DNA_END=1559 /DNA_ORIENTATION=-
MQCGPHLANLPNARLGGSVPIARQWRSQGQHHAATSPSLAGLNNSHAAQPKHRLFQTCAIQEHAKIEGFGGCGPSFTLAVIGDLHLPPNDMSLFYSAREQLLQYAGPGSRVIQLGDLGHAKHAPGSRACFEFARTYLRSFGLPLALVTGNHDFEGEEFLTDNDCLEAWLDVWQQPHFWCEDLGPSLVIGLSTTRFRENTGSHHECFVDEVQMTWLEEQLQTAAAAGKPVMIFTHAPPMGCGLKSLQELHVRNRCAWLNHSDHPEQFMELVARFPNIRLWVSGHFHLAQDYEDSISVVGGCAFVQTGVIGQSASRDGLRQSRMITGDAHGYKVLTVTHGSTASPRLDLEGSWKDLGPPHLLLPDPLLPSVHQPGWLRSELTCSVHNQHSTYAQTQWFPVGGRTILAFQADGLLLEYDCATHAPIGLVCKVPPGCSVRVLRADGQPGVLEDGSDIQMVELVDEETDGIKLLTRNDHGCFYSIFQPNKYKIRKAKLLLERQAAEASV